MNPCGGNATVSSLRSTTARCCRPARGVAVPLATAKTVSPPVGAAQSSAEVATKSVKLLFAARHRRQGLCGKGLRRGCLPLEATMSGRLSKGRARQRPAPRPDPPAGRVDLWDLQGHPHLERHGGRTLHNLRARIAQRFLALGACVAPQPQARPSELCPGRLRRLRA
jgi:hypothetical protein